MTAAPRLKTRSSTLAPLPKIVFVLGKGGVGRSTVSAGLGLALAERGASVLIMEWAVSEAIAPWFGFAPAEPERGGDWQWIPTPRQIAPRLCVFNYRLREALRGYFADHLGLPLFYQKVIDGAPMRRLIEAAPGLAELLFIGQLWWMTTLAETEAGMHFDHVVVDAPATGHGATLLDLPTTLSAIGASGLLALEVQRVVGMMHDPAHTGAIVVSMPEELAVEETLELVPRTARDLGRPPLALFVNRSVAGLVSEEAPANALASLPISRRAREALELVHGDLRMRAHYERELRSRLGDDTLHGVFSLKEQLATSASASPAEVVRAVCASLAAELGGPA